MEFSEQFIAMEKYIEALQESICRRLEEEDTVKFREDRWIREEGGGGKSRIIQNGKVFEKGGVNISSVHGKMPETVAAVMQTEPGPFAACGISLVIHPLSPRVPTVHMNLRYFETVGGNAWFGGGIDLTPYFPCPEDFRHFHLTLKKACDAVDDSYYSRFKQECDEYFTLKHRREMRGIGGIFFDYLKNDAPHYFRLVKSVGDAFLPSYLPIVRRRKTEPYNEQDKLFQLIRRGRYVEFNLIYDRGTLFGLKTGGRVESILMSLPPEVRFLYDWQPEAGSPQAEMTGYYQPHDWIG